MGAPLWLEAIFLLYVNTLENLLKSRTQIFQIIIKEENDGPIPGYEEMGMDDLFPITLRP